jgi:acid phosphatase
VSQNINHYNVLRTIEDMYGLAPLGKAASATPITSIWG